MRRPHRIFSAILATTLAFFLGGCFSKETDTGINPEPNPITQSSWVQNPDSEAATRPHCGNVDDKIAGTLEGSGGAVGLIAGVRWGEATLRTLLFFTRPPVPPPIEGGGNPSLDG